VASKSRLPFKPMWKNVFRLLLKRNSKANTQGSKFVSRTNSVISMHIPSLFSPIVGRLRIGLKLAKNMQSDYVILPSIFVAYGILAPINGGSAFYTYSHDKYELSMYDDGQFIGIPEQAFLISANVYLNE
jgi:hypothetical protein